MIYEIEYRPRFRESDHDCRVGLKGYMDYFQDIATGQYHVLGRDNSYIHELYGVAWVYAKYRLKIYDKTDFDHTLKLRAWISRLDAVRSWQEMEIFRGGELICEGRLESCLIDLHDLTIARIPRIELPDGLVVDRMTATDPFTRRMKFSDDAVYRYTHTVRYAEIDNNRHMNNLCYVPLFLNAFDLDFYDRHRITDFELQFIRQAYSGDELDVYSDEADGELRLYALNKAKELVAGCVMKTEEIS
jgi:acyl-ACP thioesterase